MNVEGKYILCRDAATRMKLTTARVAQMCAKSIIVGAVKVGQTWLIPADTDFVTLAKRKPGRPRKAKK